MIAWLQARIWQIGAGAAALVALGLAGSLLVAKIENRTLTKQLDQQGKALSQARSNVSALEAAVAKQNAEIERQGRLAAERLARTEAALAEAAAARRDAERRSAGLLKNPPKGETLDARIRDVDARILEALK